MSFNNGVNTVLFVLITMLSVDLSAANPGSTAIISSDCPKTEAFCKGTLKYEDGSVYEGEFRFGEPHGAGTIKWLDGTAYEGEFLGGFRHGKGTQTLDNGSSYEGNWRLDVMQGEGTFTWANGAVYKGEFYEDSMDGKGELKLANGDSWIGEFKTGKPSGKGIFKNADGSACKEPRKEGKRHGLAITDWESGQRSYVEWNMGVPVDKMAVNFANGDQCVLYWEAGELSKDIVYIVKDADQIETTLSKLEKEFKGDAVLVENIQFTYYTLALQHKAKKDFRTAMKLMKAAEAIAVENKDLSKNISSQMTYLKGKL